MSTDGPAVGQSGEPGSGDPRASCVQPTDVAFCCFSHWRAAAPCSRVLGKWQWSVTDKRRTTTTTTERRVARETRFEDDSPGHPAHEVSGTSAWSSCLPVGEYEWTSAGCERVVCTSVCVHAWSGRE